MTVLVIGERSLGSSMVLVCDQVVAQLKKNGFEVEVADADDKSVVKLVNGRDVVLLAPKFLTKWVGQERWVHPKSVTSVYTSNWQEADRAWQLWYLGVALTHQEFVHVSHSWETTEAVMETARTWLNTRSALSLQHSIRTVPYGIEQPDLKFDAERGLRWIVPYNRINESQKQFNAHVAATRRYNSLMLAGDMAGSVAPVDFYALDNFGKGTDRSQYDDAYRFLPCEHDREKYWQNLSQYSAFLSTSKYESFGIFYLELLLAGVVGVFEDHRWVRKLLPGYKFVAPRKQLPELMRHVTADMTVARQYVQTIVVPMIREAYALDKFGAQLSAVIKEQANA